MKALLSMGIVGMFIFVAIWVMAIISTVYGIYLAFSASIILGFVVLLVEPSPLIIGLVMMFFHKNLAQMLLDFLNK